MYYVYVLNNLKISNLLCLQILYFRLFSLRLKTSVCNVICAVSKTHRTSAPFCVYDFVSHNLVCFHFILLYTD